MNKLGNLFAQGAMYHRTDALRATAGNVNFDTTQNQGKDPMLMFTQMM
jgi:hypothetical protein